MKSFCKIDLMENSLYKNNRNFRANVCSHPQSAEIYAELIQHGHRFDSSWISRPMMPDETVVSILNSHSERLALAFNFITLPVPSPIQIVKNLRICGDCRKIITSSTDLSCISLSNRCCNQID